MARHRVGKRERQARKRQMRVWVAGKGWGSLHANFRFFLRYPETESPPFKVGHRHSLRNARSLRRWAIGEMPAQGLARNGDA